MLISRSVEVGDVVQPGKALMVLAASGQPQILIQIDEKNLSKIALGQKAFGSADAFASQRFDAVVGYINPGIDAARGSVEVKLNVANPPAYLRQDMTVSVDIETARRTATVVGLDFTLVVFDAFIKAVGLEAAQRPACRVQWPLLAAISRVESRHGTFGTSIVDPFGQVTPPIIGPPLNGLGFAYIADSDGGLYDFDTVYDRAVGPMQFIPSSWAIFGRDGDGDGRRDPNNYYDATVAAAEHLCRSGVDVGTESGAQSAVFGYNQSNDYVALVLSLRDLYAAYRPSSLVVSVR